MAGYITSKKLFVPGTTNPHPEGLLSEKIFGPKVSFRCACEKLSSKIDEGKICSKCGVECCSNDKRLTEFGTIELIFPIIKPNKKKPFAKIVGNSNKPLLDPVKADASIATERYLAVKISGDELKIVNKLEAIQNYQVLPLRITGIYSFILALRFVADRLGLLVAKNLFQNDYVIRQIRVIPPDVRPIMVKLTKPTEFIMTDVNKYYTSLVGLTEHYKVLKSTIPNDEEVWLDQLAEMTKLQYSTGIFEEMVESPIIEYDTNSARYQYYADKVYEEIYKTLSGKQGFIRGSILGRTIEFSARAVIRVDPSLRPWEIKVSKRILFRLWYPHFLRYLTTVKDWEYDECLRINNNYNVVKSEFNDFLETFCNDNDISKQK